jgi:hypothetical protein
MTTLMTSQMLLPRKGPATAIGLATILSMFHFVEQKPARLGVRGGASASHWRLLVGEGNGGTFWLWVFEAMERFRARTPSGL